MAGRAEPGRMRNVADEVEREIVDIWFDPTCPWAWITSRWLLEVQAVRPVTVGWHLMSLWFLNETREISADYRRRLEPGLGVGRVAMAARQRSGEAALARLYTSLGEAIHVRGEARDRRLLEGALAAAGLDADLVDAATGDQHDAALRSSHDEAMARAGDDVGTPIVTIGHAAFFGPIVSPIPRGEAAGRLWDGCLLVAGTDGFYELKRSRDRRPSFD